MADPIREYLRTPHVAGRLQELREPSVWRFTAAVLFNYALIAAAIFFATQALSWSAEFNSGASATTGALLGAVAVLLAVILIAARQHALLVLMHEGAHRSISRNRIVNDTLSDLLCGAPLLVSTRSYRSAHLAHHQHLNTNRDPDWCRKVDNKKERDQWLFPASAPLAQLLATLYGHSVLYLLRSLSDNQRASGTDTATESPTESKAIPSDKTLATAKYALYAVTGTVLTLSSSWTGFLLFWLAPMLLVLPLIMRIRSIAEHFALRHDHPLRQTRTVRAGRLERLILAPHHIGLHIDHHLLASVPFFQLPALHQLLLECPAYRDNAHINDGYFLPRRKAADSGQTRKATFSRDLYGAPSDRLQPVAADDSQGIQTATG